MYSIIFTFSVNRISNSANRIKANGSKVSIFEPNKMMKKYFYGLGLTSILLLFGYQLVKPSNLITRNGDIEVFTYTKQFSNIHIIKRNKRYLIIDAGLPNDHKNILSFLKQHKIAPELIEYIVLTHAHPDHAGNAAFFQQKFGTKIIVGKADLPIIQSGGFDKNLCPRGIQGKIIEATIATKRYQPFVPDILVQKAMDLSSIGWFGRVEVFTSHTEGSLVIFMDDMVFVGDLIKGQNIHKQKPSFHLFMCDLSENIQNLNTIAQNKGIKKWYLGHFGPLRQEAVLEFIDDFDKSY